MKQLVVTYSTYTGDKPQEPQLVYFHRSLGLTLALMQLTMSGPIMLHTVEYEEVKARVN